MGRSISRIAAVLASTMTVSYMDTLISDQEKFVYHEADEVGRVTVGLIQMAMGQDAEENIRTAEEKVRGAIASGANIICLPELFHSRYFPRHPGTDVATIAETVPGRSTALFSTIAREHEVVIIVPVFEEGAGGRYYNTAAVIDADGTLCAQYHKVHIPQDPGFFEKGYFYPGDGSLSLSVTTSGSPRRHGAWHWRAPISSSTPPRSGTPRQPSRKRATGRMPGN
jgi:Carbon-nitrogen hydrolase